MIKFKACISAGVAAFGLMAGVAGSGFAGQDGHAGHDHSAAKHDHAPSAGGIVAEIGDYDAELVAAGTTLKLLLKDHDGNVAMAEGLKASVLVLTGPERQGPFNLTPAGGNTLAGDATTLKPGQKVIVTLTDKAGKAAQGRYEWR
jgi:hypothetical protein